VGGTRRVLGAALRHGVKRVVFTSSLSAVVGNFYNMDPAREITEEDWPDPSSQHLNEYYESKIAAEKEAWKIWNEAPESSRFSLAAIHPVVVFGPPLLRANATAATVAAINKIIKRYLFVFPNVYMNVCDVRDVATAHLKALTVDAASGHRHIIVNERATPMPVIADLISEQLSPLGYSIPTTRLPYWLVYLASFFSDKAKDVELVWGKEYTLSNERMVNVLGVQPTPLKKTLSDMIEALIELEMVPQTEKYRLAKGGSGSKQ